MRGESREWRGAERVRERGERGESEKEEELQ